MGLTNEELFNMASKKIVLPEIDEKLEVKIPSATSETKVPPKSVVENLIVPNIVLNDMSDATSKDIKLAPEDEGKEFIIEDVELTQPKTLNPDGTFNPGQKFSDKPDSQTGYKTKLKITYKDSTYVSYLPNIKWFKNTRADGTIVLAPWFGMTPKKSIEADLKNIFVCEVTKLYFKFCAFTNNIPGKISRTDFLEGLKGKKVVLKTVEYEFEGTKYRIDIEKFV